MTSYNEDFTFPVAFPKEHMVNILGDVLENNGIKQFRTAETEKYAHVTFSLTAVLMNLKLMKQEFLCRHLKLQHTICSLK